MAAYYIEVLSSLKVVDIYVKCPVSGPGCEGDAIRLTSESELRIDVDTVIKLPVTVALQTATRSQLPSASPASGKGAWIRIRASISPECMRNRLEHAPPLITSIEKPVAASAIQGLRDGRFYDAYTELCCDNCAQVVGEVGRMGSRQMAKLYLHCIQLVLPDERPVISTSLSQVVCRDILNHVGAHAIYRFVVEGRKSCKPVALIHVVGWNAEIKARAATGSHAVLSSRCIKVLYTQEGVGGFEAQAKQWLEDSSAEIISLLDADAASLLCILADNARLLPSQLRGMANMTRSFLVESNI
ncbi:hypothetical protein EV174_000063 [Coemansia sp. RSA 2320]|nr:hypothetical protein EV174_000063 [Coemansia sp. RSA 2320]